MKKYLRDPSFVTGLAITIFMVGVLLLGFVWMPYDPTAMDMTNKLAGPSAKHILGCDQFGRDVACRLMKGLRVSFLIGLAVVAAGGAMGILLGLFAGTYGSWLDEILMKFTDAQMAFPGVLLALMLIAVFGNGMPNTVLALSIMAVPKFVRITRSSALRLRETDFVAAERVRGAGTLRIMFYHMLPNMRAELAATASLSFAAAVMSEAGLSYLGLGLVPPNPSLGLMLSEAQGFVLRAPWFVLMPAGAITLLVMGFNLLGDGIQQASK